MSHIYIYVQSTININEVISFIWFVKVEYCMFLYISSNMTFYVFSRLLSHEQTELQTIVLLSY